MIVRNYKAADKDACIGIFKSNCPKFFDETELIPFIEWLEKQGSGKTALEISLKDCYYVIELPDQEIVACGGFYILKEVEEARLAWGMIHSGFHRKGFGTLLYNYRFDKIRNDWPQHRITLGTSQHTYTFYEKMGMKVIGNVPKGYGEQLDRFDMEK